MSSFQQILQIAQEQAEAAARGDLMGAAARLHERGLLLEAAPLAEPSDADTIREILRLDVVLAGSIRERMAAISDEVKDGLRGRLALGGYGHPQARRPLMFDAVG